MPATPISRVCSTCKVPKPNTVRFFQPRSRKTGGLQSYCRDCNGTRTKAQHARRRLLALQHYSGSSQPFCSCCGESHLEFLAIDHIEGGGAAHRRVVGSSFFLWLQREGYPSGFRILCHNCNLAMGYYGRCPHQGPSITTALSERTSRAASPPRPLSTPRAKARPATFRRTRTPSS